MKKLFNQLLSGSIIDSIDKYKENGVLCGYELNTYTNGGVNMILFVDFRDTDKNPKSEEDFMELLTSRVNSIDIDEEIEIHRQDKNYKANFTIKESLQDFEEYKTSLLEELRNLQLT